MKRAITKTFMKRAITKTFMKRAIIKNTQRTLLPLLLFIGLIGLDIVFLDQIQAQAVQAIQGDYRSKASGDWDDLSTWEIRGASNTWTTATTLPNSTTNVFIRKMHTVRVDVPANCANLWLNSSGDRVSDGQGGTLPRSRLIIDTDSLKVAGSVGAYLKDDPTNTTTFDISKSFPPNQDNFIETLNNGQLVIVHNPNLTVGETRVVFDEQSWSSQSSHKFSIVFQLNEGEKVRLSAPFSAGIITIDSGIVETDQVFNANNELSTLGEININKNGKLNYLGDTWDGFNNQLINKLLVEGSLELRQSVQMSFASIEFPGTLLITSDIGNQLPIPNNGGAILNKVGKLHILAGNGNVLLKNDLLISEELAIFSGATLTTDTQKITYESEARLYIESNNRPTTTNDLIWPSTGGPQHIVIKRNVAGSITLHKDLTVQKSFTVLDGNLSGSTAKLIYANDAELIYGDLNTQKDFTVGGEWQDNTSSPDHIILRAAANGVGGNVTINENKLVNKSLKIEAGHIKTSTTAVLSYAPTSTLFYNNMVEQGFGPEIDVAIGPSQVILDLEKDLKIIDDSRVIKYDLIFVKGFLLMENKNLTFSPEASIISGDETANIKQLGTSKIFQQATGIDTYHFPLSNKTVGYHPVKIESEVKVGKMVTYAISLFDGIFSGNEQSADLLKKYWSVSADNYGEIESFNAVFTYQDTFIQGDEKNVGVIVKGTKGTDSDATVDKDKNEIKTNKLKEPIIVTLGNSCFFNTVTIETKTIENVTCKGQGDGSILLNIEGLSGELIFSWTSNFGASFETKMPKAEQLVAGLYSVVVRDANNCGGSLTNIEITEPDALDEIQILPTSSSCGNINDGSLEIQNYGLKAGRAFEWRREGETNILSTTNKLENIGSGNFVATVKENGCEISKTATLIGAGHEVKMKLLKQITCGSNSEGSLGFTVKDNSLGQTYEVQWSKDGMVIIPYEDKASSNERLNDIPSGLYKVSVRVKGGNCVNEASYNLTVPEAITAQFQVISAVGCDGDRNGNVKLVNLKGGAGVDYPVINWFNTNTNESFNGINPTTLSAGLYNVTVYDKPFINSGGAVIPDPTSCKGEFTYQLMEPVPLSLTIVTEQAVSCNPGNDGVLKAVVNGGNAPYTYRWFKDGQTINSSVGAILFSVAPGNYSVKVRDQVGCTIEQATVIDAPVPVSISSSVFKEIVCKGGQEGEIQTTVSGGTAPFSFIWRNLDTNETFAAKETASNLKAGNYRITVKDANGCTASTESIIENREALELESETIKPQTVGAKDGAITLKVKGGVAPYSYDWINIASKETKIEGLSAGKYVVVITDAKGCTLNKEYTITEGAGGGTPTAIGENHFDGVYAYPNPANDFVKFEGLPIGIYEAIVIDGQGNVVLKDRFEVAGDEKTILQTNDLANGVFTIGLESKSKPIYLQIIIQH